MSVEEMDVLKINDDDDDDDDDDQKETFRHLLTGSIKVSSYHFAEQTNSKIRFSR